MESSLFARGHKQSSRNILTYHRDENGLIQWDDPAEQTTEGFDEPDGDISLRVVCSDREGLSSKGKPEISALKTPSNFLLRTGSLLHINHSNPTGSNESDQQSFRQHHGGHTFPPNNSRQRSLLNDPEQTWRENKGSSEDAKILVRPQYSPLTPPATPKKSPKAVGFQESKSPLTAHSAVLQDVSKFPFPDQDEAHVRSNCTTQLPPAAREIISAGVNRANLGFISPVKFDDVLAKSPIRSAFKFEESVDKATIHKIINRFNDDITSEEDIRPIALQDPPKPKHKKKTVTWHQDTLREGYQQRGTTENERRKSSPSNALQPRPCHKEHDVVSYRTDFSEKDDTNATAISFNQYHDVPREFPTAMTSPPRKRQNDPCTSPECATPPKQECVGNRYPDDDRQHVRKDTSLGLRSTANEPVNKQDIFHPNPSAEERVDPFYAEAARLRNQSKLELLMMLQSSYKNEQNDDICNKTCDVLGYRISNEQSRFRDTVTDRRRSPTLCKSPRLTNISPTSPFRVPTMSPSGRKLNCASPRQKSCSTNTHFLFPPAHSPTFQSRSSSPFPSSTETFPKRRQESTFHIPASPTTRDHPNYRCKSPRGQNSSSPHLREAITLQSSPFSAQAYTPTTLLRTPPREALRMSSTNTSHQKMVSPDWSQPYPEFRQPGGQPDTSTYPRSSVPPKENPWRFPPVEEASPSSSMYKAVSGDNVHSATRRRLFNSEATPSDSDDDSVLMNSIFNYLVQKDILSQEDSNKLRENAIRRNRSPSNTAHQSSGKPSGSTFVNRFEGISEQFGVSESEAEYSYLDGEERRRVLRLRGHSMGDVEEHLSQHVFHARPAVHRSHSMPEVQTPRRAQYSEPHHHNPERRPQSRIGNIDIKVECEDVVEYNRQLADDLSDLRSPSGSSNCSCAEVEEHILQMTREAYANIRRHDDSPEAFSRFESEVQHTNDTITDALRILRTLKRLCGHGRRIEEIYSGSVVFTVNCPSPQSLEELWYWYQTGELAQMFQSGFITERLKSQFNAKGIKLRVTIEEADVLACRQCLEVASYKSVLRHEFSSEENSRNANENLPDGPHLKPKQSRAAVVSSAMGSHYNDRFPEFEGESHMVENPDRQMTFGKDLAASNNCLGTHVLGEDIYDALYHPGDGMTNGNMVLSPTRKAFQELKYNL